MLSSQRGVSFGPSIACHVVSPSLKCIRERRDCFLSGILWGPLVRGFGCGSYGAPLVSAPRTMGGADDGKTEGSSQKGTPPIQGGREGPQGHPFILERSGPFRRFFREQLSALSQVLIGLSCPSDVYGGRQTTLITTLRGSGDLARVLCFCLYDCLGKGGEGSPPSKENPLEAQYICFFGLLVETSRGHPLSSITPF